MLPPPSLFTLSPLPRPVSFPHSLLQPFCCPPLRSVFSPGFVHPLILCVCHARLVPIHASLFSMRLSRCPIAPLLSPLPLCPFFSFLKILSPSPSSPLLSTDFHSPRTEAHLSCVPAGLRAMRNAITSWQNVLRCVMRDMMSI
jgi:hypothetical protein